MATATAAADAAAQPVRAPAPGANWFPLALGPSAQRWIMHLPEASIWSWPDLCEQFVNAFQGGYKRPGTMGDLHSLV